MFVQEYGKYSLVLNKFPVFPNHLLMITTQFEPQTDHLTQSDIGAALDIIEQLKETETSPSWMTFYNRYYILHV
jgi:ATP adenylyltransferase